MSDQFSAAELANMRTAQTGHMLDTCIIQTYARTFNSFGEPVETWTDAAASISCGLDMRPGRETPLANMTTLAYDATIRLSITTVIDARDRIKVTYRFGELLSTALVYRIEAPIQRGPSGIRLTLRRVEV
jgi:head-tail adaptor